MACPPAVIEFEAGLGLPNLKSALPKILKLIVFVDWPLAVSVTFTGKPPPDATIEAEICALRMIGMADVSVTRFVPLKLMTDVGVKPVPLAASVTGDVNGGKVPGERAVSAKAGMPGSRRLQAPRP